MSIGIMELIFILVTASFYFYALYLLISALYETNRSDRPQPNGEHEESKKLDSAVLHCLNSSFVMIISTLLLSSEAIALGYLLMIAATTLTLIVLTYFYLLYVSVLALYETYRSDRPQPNKDGPAIECYYGTNHWYLNAIAVRETPAMEMTMAEIEEALGKKVKVIK